MTADALHRLAAEGDKKEADAIVVMAEKQDILAAHPDGQRRFYEMKGGGSSNSHHFWIGSEAALKATESYSEGGQFAKHPSRLVTALGIMNLIRFSFGLQTPQ